MKRALLIMALLTGCASPVIPQHSNHLEHQHHEKKICFIPEGCPIKKEFQG